MSSKHFTRKPPERQTSATRSIRGVTGPSSSPRRTSSQPLWCACPGALMDAPNPPTTPTITRSRPSTAAAVSGPPRPFWMESTTVSGPSSGFTDSAAWATCIALVARMTRSQGPASLASVVALTRTVRSPEAPSTRKPLVRIASMCSRQVSTAHTSCPAEASSPAYTEPIAPAPTTAIFMLRTPLISQVGGAAPRRAAAGSGRLPYLAHLTWFFAHTAA